MFWKHVYRSTAPSPGEQHWKSTLSAWQYLSSSWRHCDRKGKRSWAMMGTLNIIIILLEFHALPYYRRNPIRYFWICSIVWIPFLNDWQSLPGEPATDTQHQAGTWQRRAGEASGFYTVNRWCRHEGVPAGSWCQLYGMMKAFSPSFFSFLSHPWELLQLLCKIFGINVWIPTTAIIEPSLSLLLFCLGLHSLSGKETNMPMLWPK